MAAPIIQTRRGWTIETEEFPEEPPARLAAYHNRYKREFPLNELRRGPTAAYNCFGMVFAVRRASVMETSIETILQDDRYRRLRQEEHPSVGDVAIYKEGAEIEHAGVLVGFKEPIMEGGSRIPIVMSKWGPGPEYIHLIESAPYGKVEIWTDRS